MKFLFSYLLIVSICFNFYFAFRKYNNFIREKETRSLHFFKDITFKEGFGFFKKKIKTCYPEIDIDQKLCLIYFWDSTEYYDHHFAMRSLDSLATTLGKHTFNYFFITEMGKNSTNEFLKMNEVQFTNFRVLCEMDDFMSGVYSVNPIKWKKLGSNIKDSSKIIFNTLGVGKFKKKPFYFIMDSIGEILFLSSRYSMPIKDSIFVNRLKLFASKNSVKPLDN